MTASFTFFNSFRKYASDGTFTLASNTYKATLHTSSYVPDAQTQTVYADLTNELSTANGYTNGGQALTTTTWTQSTVTVAFDADDTTWTASGGSIVSRYLVVRAVGTLNGHVDPLMFWILMDTTPADVTITSGNQLQVQWNAVGVFTQT